MLWSVGIANGKVSDFLPRLLFGQLYLRLSSGQLVGDDDVSVFLCCDVGLAFGNFIPDLYNYVFLSVLSEIADLNVIVIFLVVLYMIAHSLFRLLTV